MPMSLTCKGCKSTLKIPDQFAGKKVKCPKCAAVLAVPGGTKDDEEFVAVEVVDERVKSGPKKAKPTARDDDEDDDREERRKSTRVKAGRDEDRRSPRFREEDDIDRKRKKRRRDDDDERDKDGFKPCPRCGATGAKRVLWTAWGSFYGPAMFHHVRCPDCGSCFNGRSGKSNTLAAITFVSVPLLGIGAILGAVFFMLFKRGYFGG